MSGLLRARFHARWAGLFPAILSGLLPLFSPQMATAQTVITTVAGGGSLPDGRPALTIPVGAARAVAVDGAGNLFIAAVYLDVIFKVTAAGEASMVAGRGTCPPSSIGDGGPATAARLDNPSGVVVDAAGNLFIADSGHYRVRRVDAVSGVITTFAGGGAAVPGDGGPAVQARLDDPWGLALDASGHLLIADSGAGRVRRVDVSTRIITTVAGGGGMVPGDGGPAVAAALSQPRGIAIDPSGNLLIAESGGGRIRRVDASTGVITTVAGGGPCCAPGDGGPATSAYLNDPESVAVDGAGTIFLSDIGNFRVRRVDAVTGIISTYQTGLLYPAGIAADTGGNLFIAYEARHLVRKREPGGAVTIVAGNGTPSWFGDGGPATEALLSEITGVAVDGDGNVYVADTDNGRVRRVDATTGNISTYAGGGTSNPGDGGPAIGAVLSFWSGFPAGLALDGDGNLFIGDNQHLRVRRVDAATGIITTVAGNGSCCSGGDGGPATSARLNIPFGGLAIDGGGDLFIADSDSLRVRRVDAATQIITTYAGSCCNSPGEGDGGPATSAYLYYPSAVAAGAEGQLLIADEGGNKVRRVDAATHVITTAAGGGLAGLGDGGPATAGGLNWPEGVALDGAGSFFIADRYNHRVRRVDAASGIMTTLAGGFQSCASGSLGDGGPAAKASLREPLAVAASAQGSVFIADTLNRRIRRVDPQACTGLDADGDGHTACVDDCDDSNPGIHAGHAEVCDGLDDDCDGVTPEDEKDWDCDGYMACAGDCNDFSSLFHPGNVEECDGFDNDCNSAADDRDLDGDGANGCSDDCDDGNPLLGKAPVAVDGLDVLDITGGYRFSWNSQAPQSGSSTVYDVYSGGASDLRPGGDFSTGSCRAEDLPGASLDHTGPDPAPRQAFYFLFRAQNACPNGTGTWGDLGRDAKAALSSNPCR